MPLTMVTVTGTPTGPDNTGLGTATIEFVSNEVQPTGGDILTRKRYSAPLASDGDFSVSVAETTGDNFYNIYVRTTVNGRQVYYEQIGTAIITGPGPVALSDVLIPSRPYAGKTYTQAAQEAAADAAAAASAAQAAQEAAQEAAADAAVVAAAGGIYTVDTYSDITTTSIPDIFNLLYLPGVGYYSRDNTTPYPAVTSLDGDNWVPDGMAYVDHFGENTNPGVANVESTIVQASLWASLNGVDLWFNGTHGVENLNCLGMLGKVSWKADGEAKIVQLSTRDHITEFVRVGGELVATETYSVSSADAGGRVMTVNPSSQIAEGHLIKIWNGRLIKGEHRFYDQEGQYALVTDRTGDVITLKDILLWEVNSKTIATGTAQGGTADTIQLASGSLTSSQITRYKLRITGGTGAGQERWIANFDDSTQTVELDATSGYTQDDWTTVPDNTSTYEIVAEPTVEVIRPVDITIEGLEFIGAPRFGYSNRGVRPYYGNEILVKDVTVSGCSDYAIRPTGFYRCRVLDCNVSEANFAFGGSDGRGYGVVFTGGWLSIAVGNQASNCRTGFDSSDGCTHVFRARNKVIGGGPTHDGGTFFPDIAPDAPNRQISKGISSHAASVYVHDVDNDVHNCSFAYHPRSYDTKIQGGLVTGSSEGFARIGCNRSVLIDGVKYDSGQTYATPFEYTNTFQVETKYLPASGALLFHRDQQGPCDLTIKNCEIKGLSGPFFVIGNIATSTNARFMDIELSNNTVQFSLTPDFPVACITDANWTSSDYLLRGYVEDNNKVYVYDDNNEATSQANGFYPMKFFRNISPDVECLPKHNGSVVKFVQDDQAIAVPVFGDVTEQRQGAVRVEVTEMWDASTGWNDVFMGYAHNDGTWDTVVQTADFSAPVGTALTGTTGADGSLNIGRAEGTIYVENRLGGGRLLAVRAEPV